MTQDMLSLESFFSKINLHLNTSKTKFIIFETKNQNMHNIFDSISFNNTIIHSISSCNFLGLTLDDKLSLNEHIINVLNTITPYLNVMRKMRYSVNKSTLYNIYYAYVHSRITYLLPKWGVASN
jgi:hypothetical protein